MSEVEGLDVSLSAAQPQALLGAYKSSRWLQMNENMDMQYAAIHADVNIKTQPLRYSRKHFISLAVRHLGITHTFW